MHDHVAQAMYHVSIHLLFASVVASVAWALTSLLNASAGAKYWIWVAAAFNFALPSGALIDALWRSHLTWARPIGAIGGPLWDLSQGSPAAILGATWAAGAFSMLGRLVWRIRKENREDRRSSPLSGNRPACHFLANGIPVSFGEDHPAPVVRGVFYPRILLPAGIDRLLNPRELHAVLIHELTHAHRRDNLIRLLYEASLCVLWFHPLMWLAGAKIGQYREVSCDECVIRREHGPELVSALAKLAVPGQTALLQAAASSHLSVRLALLAAPPKTAGRAASLLLTSLFAAVVGAGIFQTVAHTACCFVHKR